MNLWWKNRRAAGLLTASAVLLTVMGASSAGQGESPWLKDAVTAVSVPLQRWNAAAWRTADGFFARLFRYDELAEENQALREEAETLREALLDYEDLARENRELKQLLRVAEEHPDYSFAAAQVLGPDPDLGFARLILDQGTESGIEAQDLVMTSGGLVGTVEEAGRYSAVVMTFLHPQFRTGAYESASGLAGVAAGSAELAGEGRCELRYLDGEPEPGAIAATAGTGGASPRGIPSGWVRESGQLPSGTSWRAELEPFVQLEAVTEVFVVTGFAGEGAG